LPATAREDR